MTAKTSTDRQAHRNTPVTYSAVEARALRKAFARDHGHLHCPRCDGRMLVEPPFETRGRLVSELYCEHCRHCVIVWVEGHPRRKPAGGSVSDG